MSTKSQDKRITRDSHLIEGISKHFGKGEHIAAGGKQYEPAEVVAMLKERIDVAKPVAPAKAAWIACVKEQSRVLEATDSVVLEVIAFLRLRHGGDDKVLADFGLAPKKRQGLTPEQKVARAEKARKTRELRHTMGKRQKEQLSAPATAMPNGAPQPK